jgi:hypothetical protein
MQRGLQHHKQHVNPLIGLALVYSEQPSLYHLEGIGFQVGQDKQQPILGRRQRIVLIGGIPAGRMDVHQALAQLTHDVNAAGASWGLLLYIHGPDPSRIAVEVQQAASIIALSVDELLEGLRTSSFFDIIRDLRNKKVHGFDR